MPVAVWALIGVASSGSKSVFLSSLGNLVQDELGDWVGNSGATGRWSDSGTYPFSASARYVSEKSSPVGQGEFNSSFLLYGAIGTSTFSSLGDVDSIFGFGVLSESTVFTGEDAVVAEDGDVLSGGGPLAGAVVGGSNDNKSEENDLETNGNYRLLGELFLLYCEFKGLYADHLIQRHILI